MNKQKGYATLFISVILLLLVTLNVFMGVRGSVIEQQSANNAYMTASAFELAEQGRSLFISNLNTYVTSNPSVTLSAALATVQAATNVTGAKYAVSYALNADGSYTLTSVGKEVGNTTRKVSQRVKLVPGAPGGGKAAALNALGNIDMGGHASATSANAGGGITTGGSSQVTGPANANTTQYKVACTIATGLY